MARYFKKRIQNKGLAPGAKVFIGKQKMPEPIIKLLVYSPSQVKESDYVQFRDLAHQHFSNEQVSWVNVYGIHDVALFEQVEQIFHVHPMVLEDMMNTAQRPKYEEYDKEIFIVLKMLFYNEEKQKIEAEQISFLLHEHYLLTFQEKRTNVFEPIRERIRKNPHARIRQSSTDYLAYCLLDTIVDNYIYMTEKLGDQIDELEAQLLGNKGIGVTDKIYFYKKELTLLAKVIKPVREIIKKLKNTDTPLIKDSTNTFINDLDDLVIHTIETIDTYKEVLNDYLILHSSNESKKLNEIMKVLTMFSAIFIPLTFIVGVYGTNFDFLPELHYKYGYLFMWIGMILLALWMMRYFKRKKWL